MTNISDSDWETFVSQFSNAHLLQTTAWGQLKSDFGWYARRVIAENTGAQILFRRLPLGLTWAYLPKGPVGTQWDRIWPQVDAVCRQNRAIFLKVEPDIWENESDSFLSWLPVNQFQRSPHDIQPPRTILVDISLPEDEILAGMKQKTRYNIRLAARKGVKTAFSDDVDRFYQLMQVTGERETFGVHSAAYYRRAFELFAPQDQCRLISAEFDGKWLAALMIFALGDTAWYFYGASSNEHRNLMAPYAAQWAAIRWAKSKGCTRYDLWGVPDADGDELEAHFMARHEGLWGVYRFKRGFGGQVIRMKGTWDRVYNPILYSLYRLWMKKNES